MKKILLLQFNCKGYFAHFHKTKLAAQCCHWVQSRLPMSKIHFYFLKLFNPEKYFKMNLALKGSNKRATLRRAKKGMKLI